MLRANSINKTLTLIIIASMYLIFNGCASDTETVQEIVLETVVVEKEIVKEVEVIKEVEVKKIVEKEVPVVSEKIIEKNMIEVPATSYPVNLTDMLNQNIVISNLPERIISISPTATEMIYKLEKKIIARDSSSKFPEEILDLPTVGSAYTPNIEMIIQQEPDLLVIEALTQSRFMKDLARLNVPILAVRATSLNDVTQSMKILGSALDVKEKSDEVIFDINAKIDLLKKNVDQSQDIIILISDADRNIYAAKPESYAGAVAKILGLGNLAEGMSDMGPYPGYTLWTPEQVATSNPSYIFTISPAPPPAPKLSTMLPMFPGYANLDAVTNNKVKELDPILFMQAPGPRMINAVEEIKSYISE